MLKSLILALFCLLLVAESTLGTEDKTTEKKNILILFSMSPSSPAYRILLDGIRQKLYEEYGDLYNLHMEYLESDRYPSGKYPHQKFDIYNEKYSSIRLDLLICVGVDVAKILKDNAAGYLVKVPLILIDYDYSQYWKSPDYNLSNRTVNIRLKINLGATLSDGLTLFPKTTSVYFVCGGSRLDSLFYEMSKMEARNIEDKVSVTFLRNMSMDEILMKVRNLPKNSIIVVSSFNLDGKKVTYFYNEAVRLISTVANAPVFAYTDSGFGEGAVGGYVISFRKVAEMTVNVALAIMNGTDTQSFIFSEKDYYQHLFDWRALKRWKVEDSIRWPSGTEVQFRKTTFFEKYTWYIILGGLFMFIQTVLIIILIRWNRRQKTMMKIVIETENKYRTLYREDRILRIGKLTATLSHELSQPLTAILNTAQAGARFIETGKSNPQLMAEILKHIVEDDRRASSILSSVRGMMRLEKREKEKVNLNNLIYEVSDLCHSSAIELKGKIELKLTDVPAYAFADPIQIQQVLMNLILNASQAMEKTHMKNNIIVSETTNESCVFVSVRDFGPGIEPLVFHSLFNPFVTSKSEGTGMGLAICRSIIEEHDGQIQAANLPDGGAIFTFTLKNYHD